MTKLEILCKVHNQQGGTIHQFNDMYNTDFILDVDNKTFFKVILAKCFENNFVNNPDKYNFGLDKLGDVAGKLLRSIDDMSFNKDTDSFKQTCKLLGIKNTYKAIREYISA